MIEAIGTSLVYQDHGRDVFACQNINLSVSENCFLGILGPSGSGKSSLLYLLSGLKIPTSGSIQYRGTDLKDLSDLQKANLRLSEFGFLFQQSYLLGYLTAVENVILGGGNNSEIQEARELLKKLDMGTKEHRFPHELSGGERQRVCVARALMGNPKVIFADEPTASLDHTNGAQVVALLNENRGKGSLVMVTHDPSMLEKADKVLEISEGELR